jgi:hypothetical protein
LVVQGHYVLQKRVNLLQTNVSLYAFKKDIIIDAKFAELQVAECLSFVRVDRTSRFDDEHSKHKIQLLPKSAVQNI